ncbi:hypothetical protein ABZ348_17660 [Streptomyces sp. NPDC005963]|uniref:hypothetical protein n=1 Tax=Streptomyces sp. NPDC005963 TaxID=3156721 RepID=UPI0033F408F0
MSHACKEIPDGHTPCPIAPLIAGDHRRIESPHGFSFVEETDPCLVPLLVPDVLSIEGDASGEFGRDWSLDHVDSRAMADLIRAGKSPLRAGTAALRP